MNNHPTPPSYRPVKVVDIEVSRPITDITDLDGYEALQGLVRIHGEPLGYVRLPVANNRCAGAAIARAVLNQYSYAIVRHLIDDRLMAASAATLQLDELLDLPHPPERGPTPVITVAVCTRDRPADLARCLAAVVALDYPAYEVVVVDNAPRDATTAGLIHAEFPTVRYVCEPRPGLSHARNRAIAEAQGELVAFTDDDVVVDAGWLRALARAFAADPAVMAVTGLVVPFELETEAQVLFEQCGGFGRGFARQEYRYPTGHPGKHATYQGAGRFGTGANMAYRKTVFAQLGAFDPALGVGTPTRGGEDLEMFFRVLRAGHTLVYEPAAFVRHRHRRDRASLRRQMASNGASLAAYHGRCALLFPEQRGVFLRLHFWWLWARHIKRLIQSLTRPHGIPRDLIVADLWGYLTGLALYPHSRRVVMAAQPATIAGANVHGKA